MVTIKYLLYLFISIFFLTFSFPTYAERGCCSWHGGVCGCDTSVGRQICCDGTYSPSCTCAYISPKLTTPVFPYMTATWSFFSNTNHTWRIKMTLNDDEPTRYSAVISKCAGCDPGPLVDFNSNHFIFDNVLPGRWYVNVKKDINNVWSTIQYWVIDVPQWVEPTTLVENLSTSDLSDNNYSIDSTNQKSNILLKAVMGFIVGGTVIYFITKKI